MKFKFDKSKKALLFVKLFLCFFVHISTSQVYDLRNNIPKHLLATKFSTSNDLWVGFDNQLNYTKPLLLYKYIERVDTNTLLLNANAFCQALSFVGDVSGINEIDKRIIKLKSNTQLLNDKSFIDSYRDIKLPFWDAKKSVLDSSKNHQIVMINEAHDRPQTRAYILSLLEDLKKQGFVNLALETLNETGNLKSIDCTTGYYTKEPVYGKIIREALKLGYKLIAYEDRLGHQHSNNQRDSVEAENLFKQIYSNNKLQKTLVIAGYAHIAEETNDPNYKFMSMYFKSISKENPLTIDQCTFIENSSFNPLPRSILDSIYIQKDTKVISGKSVSPFIFSKPSCDFYVYHPNTTYTNYRAKWLSSKNDSVYTIKIKTSKMLEKTVLIQAYLFDDCTNKNEINCKIPYDQTFMLKDLKASLVLNKNQRYNIVFRDINNTILKIFKYSPSGS